MTQLAWGTPRDGEFEFWRNHAQISLQPVAAMTGYNYLDARWDAARVRRRLPRAGRA